MKQLALSLFAFCFCSPAFATGHDFTAPTYASSALAPTPPSVAASGGRFLTVWTAGGHVYESFADQSGRVLNPIARPILDGVTAAPAIAPLGDGFALLTRINGLPALFLLSSDGNVVRRLADPPLASTNMAASQDELLITDGLTAAVLRVDGTLIGQVKLAPYSWAVSVAATNNGWVVGSSQPAGIFVHHIGRDGSSIGITTIDLQPISVLPSGLAIGSDGTNAVLLFPEASRSGAKLWAAVAAGTFVEPFQLPLPPGGAGSVRMRWTGSSYLAIANASAFHLDRTGKTIDSPSPIGENVTAFDVIGNVAYAATQTITTTISLAIDGRSFSADAPSVTTPANLWIGLRQQSAPAVSSDGLNFFAAWFDQTGDSGSIRGARMTRDGVSLDPTGIDVGPTDRFAYQGPAVAFGGSTYLVAWTDTRNLLLRRFRTDGSPIDAAPITIRNLAPFPAPAVAWNGTSFLIVAGGFATPGTSAFTIGVDGAPSGPIPVAGFSMYGPQLAWNGDVFLLVGGAGLTCFDLCTFQHGPTIAMRLSQAGTPLDSTPIVLDAPNTKTVVPTTASTVASNGRDFLVSLDGWPDVTVVPVNVHPTLIAGTPRHVFEWFGGIRSAIAFNGTSYVLMWSYQGATSAQSWLTAAHLTEDGDVLALSGTSADARLSDLTIAQNAMGDVMVAIDRTDRESGAVRSSAYFDWDLGALPPRPSAPPRNVRATGDRTYFVVEWDGVTSDTAGVVVQVTLPFRTATAPATEHSVAFQYTDTKDVAVRAFNAGGLSDRVVVNVDPRQRHRAIP